MTLKTKYDLCALIGRIAVLFWITETVFFLIRDGWHWKAVSEMEELADLVVNILFAIVLILFVSGLVDIFKLFAKAKINKVVVNENQEAEK